MSELKRWLSPPPETCDICESHITKEFVDGRTRLGPWGCLCVDCHKKEGGRLGLGFGQRYQFDGKFWIKIAG